MPSFAAVFARSADGWAGFAADPGEAESFDDLADLMRVTSAEMSADLVVFLLEQDGDWFAVLRLDGFGQPRGYCSAPRDDGLGGLLQPLLGDTTGTSGVLADLGVAGAHLDDLADGGLPGDALLTIAELAGFGDAFERLRG
ncbi:hypothetical protein [Actinomadura flavalba]|uniref:hypothetical protein n=1 Tax=Actinomadura flavalba TaxID=1120938 RepID=UPI000374A14C|nr:hypothetical protein [Actinomadura flavalba]